MARIGWDKLVSELMAEGKSKTSAEKIAYSIGKKKYGKKGMAKKARKGRILGNLSKKHQSL